MPLEFTDMGLTKPNVTAKFRTKDSIHSGPGFADEEMVLAAHTRPLIATTNHAIDTMALQANPALFPAPRLTEDSRDLGSGAIGPVRANPIQ
jgi:hypothetical protein